MNIPIFDYETIYPLARFGLTGKYFGLNIDTVAFTWVAMALLFLAVFIIKKYYFSITNSIYIGLEFAVETFADMCSESVGYFRHDYFSFVGTLFVFTFSCCLVSLLPFIEESTKDANTTFALSCASFFYILYQKSRQEGIMSFIKELFHPIFIMFPINLLGELSRIVSMSFRLFGNVLGGSVVFFVFVSVIARYKIAFISYVLLIGLLWLLFLKILSLSEDNILARVIRVNLNIVFILSWMQLFFGVFEALIQSFVIAILTITYLALSVEHDLETDKKGIEW